MKKLTAALLAAALCLSLSGCSVGGLFSNYREIDSLELVRTIAVDKTGDAVLATAGSGPLAEGGAPHISQAEASTLSLALEELQRKSQGREALLSHTETLLVGEDTARDGLDFVLDYAERSPDIRLKTNLVVARGSGAGELLKKAASERSSVAAALETMKDSLPASGKGCLFTCADAACALAERGCALLMAVEAAPPVEDDGAEISVAPAGLAVLKDGRLAGFLTEDETAGALLLTGCFRGMNADIEYGGARVSLHLSGAKCSLEPVFGDGRLLRADAALSVQADLDALSGSGDPNNEDWRRGAEEAVSELLCKMAVAALARSQAMDADFLGLGETLCRRAPLRFGSQCGNWAELFPRLEMRVIAGTVLRRTYDIDNPLGASGGEKEDHWNELIS